LYYSMFSHFKCTLSLIDFYTWTAPSGIGWFKFVCMANSRGV
jgi:hypothetical protein